MIHRKAVVRGGVLLALLPLLTGCLGDDPLAPGEGSAFDPGIGLRQNIDQYVTARVLADYPATVVRVVRDGSVVIDKAWGVLRRDESARATPDTPFYVSQLAMQFTAVSVLMLHEEGLLDLHALVEDILPDTPEPWREITVHHLLTHQSGLADYIDDLDIAEEGLTNDDVLEAVKAAPLQHRPGSFFQFTHSGYVVLAKVIEEIAQQSYASYVRENIFEPLGLEHSYVVEVASPPVPGRAVGYQTLDEIGDYELRTLGDGGIYSSLSDLGTWMDALESNALLTAATTAEMYTNFANEDYGYGWLIGDLDGNTAFYHDGIHRGFRAFIGRVPSADVTVVVLASGAYDWFFDLPGLIMMHVLGV